MRTHRDLDLWKRSMGFVETIYRVTACFPPEEIYGLTSQLRRAAVSVPSNIAEGSARDGEKEFVRFLYMALGSLAELETQIILSGNLGYLKDTKALLDELSDLKKMTNGLIRHLKKRR